MALIHNGTSGVQLVMLYSNLGQIAAFLLLPHGNSVPAHPNFHQGSKNHVFIQFPGLFIGKCTPEMPFWIRARDGFTFFFLCVAVCYAKLKLVSYSWFWLAVCIFDVRHCDVCCCDVCHCDVCQHMTTVLQSCTIGSVMIALAFHVCGDVGKYIRQWLRTRNLWGNHFKP